MLLLMFSQHSSTRARTRHEFTIRKEEHHDIPRRMFQHMLSAPTRGVYRQMHHDPLRRHLPLVTVARCPFFTSALMT